MRRPAEPVTLRPVRPNVGIEAAYRRRLLEAVRAMHDDLLTELRAAYAENKPEMAQDRSPAKELQEIIGRLAWRWRQRFAELAPELARHFAKSAADRSDRALAASLKKAGFTVQFRMTRAVNDIVQAQVAANVALIKSIGAQHLTDVEGIVMRSVQQGRDLGGLTKDLQEQYGVTRRRAAFIASDQNSKATAVVTRSRYVELGITQAIWIHSAGGKHPRPTHVKAGRDQVRYSVLDGWPDPALGGKRIWPGTEFSCRCVSRPILPGLERRAA